MLGHPQNSKWIIYHGLSKNSIWVMFWVIQDSFCATYSWTIQIGYELFSVRHPNDFSCIFWVIQNGMTAAIYESFMEIISKSSVFSHWKKYLEWSVLDPLSNPFWIIQNSMSCPFWIIQNSMSCPFWIIQMVLELDVFSLIEVITCLRLSKISLSLPKMLTI